MIIWLASYPKSGNTWLRMFLKSYYQKSSNGFKLQDTILDDFRTRGFPNISTMKHLNIDFNKFKYFDYKSQIQVFFQKKYGYVPLYKINSITGPAHNRKYKVSLHDKKIKLSLAEGKTKKEAQNNAAKKVLIKFNQI